MNILFIGNFQQGPGGEAADETHLVRELESAGHVVRKVNRDEWREFVIEKYPDNKYDVPLKGLHFDIAIICKWHHFYNGSFIESIKTMYDCPVFYWVWDNMLDGAFPDWHLSMAKAADLYLSGEAGYANYYQSYGVKFYYFQFDSTDGNYQPMSCDKDYDVVFTGSHTNQNGRLDILKAINKEIPIQVFAYDFEEWKKDGFAALPAVYGQNYNEIIARSKIVLGTSAGPDVYGYWSNRVGKVLYAHGFLLQWYTPGMEVIIGDACEYFSTSDEAIKKIRYYLANPKEIEKFWMNNLSLGTRRWTSSYKIKQLTILMERYLADEKGKSWLLP